MFFVACGAANVTLNDGFHENVKFKNVKITKTMQCRAINCDQAEKYLKHT